MHVQGCSRLAGTQASDAAANSVRSAQQKRLRRIFHTSAPITRPQPPQIQLPPHPSIHLHHLRCTPYLAAAALPGPPASIHALLSPPSQPPPHHSTTHICLRTSSYSRRLSGSQSQSVNIHHPHPAFPARAPKPTPAHLTHTHTHLHVCAPHHTAAVCPGPPGRCRPRSPA